ncbi:MAG: hypothetical protein HFE52_04280 [Clostridia bacterium]|nr:hypothetical protein [Clostridia bacterium]MCI8979867.1 hypothetical protein [Clostridia bacterium]
MCQKEVREIFSEEEIEQLKEDGYSEDDLVGLAVMKRMFDMGLTNEQIDEILFQSLAESLEERYGSDTIEELKQYTSFQDMIAKGAIDDEE